MFKIIKQKDCVLGYGIIIFAIGQFGYACYHIVHAILNNKERIIIEPNSITRIGASQFNYTNIIILMVIFLVYNIGLVLLGTFIIKKGIRKRFMQH